jgi:hypothetical protein
MNVPGYKEGSNGLVVVGCGERVPCHEHPSSLHRRGAVAPHVGCASTEASTTAIEQPAGATRTWSTTMAATVNTAWRLLVALPLGSADAIPTRSPGCCERSREVLSPGLRRELEVCEIRIGEAGCRLNLRMFVGNSLAVVSECQINRCRKRRIDNSVNKVPVNKATGGCEAWCMGGRQEARVRCSQ